MTKRIAVTVVLLAVLAALPGSAVGSGSTTIVLSEIYGGGGNAGAPYDHDFVELLNVSSSPVSLNGWSVQYASTGGSSWQSTPLPDVSLGPHQHFLVQEAGGGTNGAALPTPDATGTIALAATAGKIALASSATALSGACPTGTVDLVGYGTSTCFEGSAAAGAPSNVNSIQRKSNGLQDTDDNGADFEALAPQPQNTTSTSAVRLLSFTAKLRGVSVTLRWRVAAAGEALGYHVYRQHAGRRTRLDARLVPAAAGASLARGYVWRGGVRVPRRSDRYLLQEVRLDGTRAWLGAATA